MNDLLRELGAFGWWLSPCSSPSRQRGYVTATHPQNLNPRAPEDDSTLLIASEDLVARWSEVVTAPTDLIAVSDADPQSAIDIIARQRPRVVVLEQFFAFTAKGLALVNELRSDPDLGDVDIRMLPEERAGSHSLRTATNGRALVNMSTPLRRSPSRRVRRVRMQQGTEAVLDGSRVALVELSTAGAGVVSAQLLKPNQSVRILVERNGDVHRAEGTIAWSTAQPGPDRLSFRAGIAFRRDQSDLLATLMPNADAESQQTDPDAWRRQPPPQTTP